MEFRITDRILKFGRNCFAKPGLTPELREYQLQDLWTSPVGTLEEIFQMIKDQNLDVERIEFVDRIDNEMFHFNLVNGKWERVSDD